MKKILGPVLGLLLGLTLVLPGCGDQATARSASLPETASSHEAPAPRASTLAIVFSNASDYVFNEIYISPTASNEWGEELLGSTRILKSNGSVNLEIHAYDFDNYDILIVDEDRDEYHFTRVPLQSGNEVAIYFGEDGLAASVSDARGAVLVTVNGELSGSFSTSEEIQGNIDWIEFSFANGTSHIVITELYLMPQGTTDETEMGYNHIASAAPLNPGEYADIGVDDHTFFDILLLDTGGNAWYYQGVYLQADCLAYATNYNGPGLTVEYGDGTTEEYVGEMYV